MTCARVSRSIVYSGEGNHQYGLKGELNPTYKKDVKVTNYGYIKIRVLNHPFTDHAGWVLLHRFVMENYFLENDIDSYLVAVEGYPFKYLSKEYIIHHIDGNRLNNCVSNLEPLTLADHSREHCLEKPIPKDQVTGRFLPQGKKIKSDTSKNQLTKQHLNDAGLDIRSSKDAVVYARSKQLIRTDLFIEVPNNHVALIWSRSGLSAKHGIQAGAGCIDVGYTGEVKVLLYNHSDEHYHIKAGDRIAQLLTIPINLQEYEETEEFSNSTERGGNGYGSTGQ